MQRYSEFSPTHFDTRGLGLEERQEWLVCPVSRTRDSGPLDESNFRSTLKALGGESNDVEVHRFGHWGPGWLEVILVRPGSDAQKEAEEIEAALSDYPIVDESDHSELEFEAYLEAWDFFGASDFASALAKAYPHHSKDFYSAIPNHVMMLVWETLNPSGEYYVPESDGVYFPFDSRIGKRSGMCKPSYDEVRTAIRDAIFESTMRSKCHHTRPMARGDNWICSTCGAQGPWEKGETIVAEWPAQRFDGKES